MRGAMVGYVSVGCASVLTLAGCGSARQQFESLPWHKPALERRAAFDLNCPKAQLKYTPLDSMERYTVTGVTGCGKRATYALRQDQWVIQPVPQ